MPIITLPIHNIGKFITNIKHFKKITKCKTHFSFQSFYEIFQAQSRSHNVTSFTPSLKLDVTSEFHNFPET